MIWLNAIGRWHFDGEELEIQVCLKEVVRMLNVATGYLEDGTMVVVSDGRKALGQTA